MNRTSPFIRVVVLAYDGAGMTLECIGSILRSEWPQDRIEIVLVDNGSIDDVIAQVRSNFPSVRMIEPLRNLGFAGGCNAGITATRTSSGDDLHPFDYVALVNNDATVETGWLEPLVSALERDDRLGAASPKMVFAPTFQEIEVSRLFPDDPMYDREPVCVSSARVDGTRNDNKLSFDEGFGGPSEFAELAGEEFARWTMHGGRIRVQLEPQTSTSVHRVELRIGARAPGWVRLRTDLGEYDVRVGIGSGIEASKSQVVHCEIPGIGFDVINNVGSELYVGGSAGDRGFLERDRGQYDEQTEVFAWCGGAVLLRKEYLDDVGVFDESFFLYYEDTDLSWRGRLHGWRYVYVPTSLVRHRHAQSSVAGSDLFRFQVDRNRLLVLTKNAPPLLAARSVLGTVRLFVGIVIGDVLARIVRLRLPTFSEVRRTWKVLRSFALLFPHVLRQRWATKTRVSRRRVMSLAVDKIVPVPEFRAPGGHLPILPDRRPDTGRPRAAVFNLYWDTLGGGEVVSGEIARVLTATHEVTLLGPRQPDPVVFRDRLGIDISQCSWREVGDDAEASAASADFDLFVNGTYSSRAVNRARVGLYYVHFPRVLLPQTSKIALESGLRFVRLAAKSPLRSSKFATAERLIQQRLGDDSWVSSYTTFLANSQYTQKWIGRIWNSESQILHPPVRSRSTTHSQDGGVTSASPMKSHVIASLGRFFDPDLGHSKKQLEMLTAFADMARSRDGVEDWRLALIGGADGASRDYVLRIRRAAQDLPIDVHVNASRDTVEEALSQASIYWHASGYGEDEQRHPERFEHFGISIVEAMAAGAVPLVFGAAGPAEIVRDGVDGYHWHTLEQLARLTRRLMHDDQLVREMSLSARARARDFEPAVFDEKMRALVDSLSATTQTI